MGSGTKSILGVLALSGAILLGQSALATAESPGGFRLLELAGDTVKWGEPVLGSGAIVSYATARAPFQIAGARNCAGIVPPDGLLERNGIAASAFEAVVEDAFAVWAEAADLIFVRSEDPSAADILIGAQMAPKGRAFTNVAHASPAISGTTARIAQAVVCLNPVERWKLGFDGDLDTYDLRYTMIHEIGHAIGLDHPGVPGELMDFRYHEAFASLQPGDRAGVQRLYGAAAVSTARSADRPATEAARAGREPLHEFAFGD